MLRYWSVTNDVVRNEIRNDLISGNHFFAMGFPIFIRKLKFSYDMEGTLFVSEKLRKGCGFQKFQRK